MERQCLDKERGADTRPPHLPRATLRNTPSAVTQLPAKVRAALGRYGVALVLTGLALLLVRILPFPEGTGIYLLPVAAVVLSAWYGGRGPGVFASIVCATGTLYLFVPPRNSFEIAPDHGPAFWIFIAVCLLLGEFSSRRRLTENALRASEERFRTFVDRATDGFFLLDEKVRIVDVNRQACESLGWSREELIGMQPRMFDAGLDETSIGRLTQRIGAGEIITFETRHRRKDGTVFPVEVRTGTFQQGGKRYHLALARDISERKLADAELRATEARFRTLVEAAADAFMLHAEDSTVIDVNRQACENLGYSRQELIGMKPVQFDADLDAEALQRVADRTGPGDIVTIETHHRRKDGSVFPVELRLRQVVQGGRRVTISLARDITERKRVEEERERRRRLETELARVSRLTTLGELTASIAHEVSQPLGGMVASAGACVRWLAARPPAIKEAQAALENIVADGKRAREVIARIRALTKRQAPRRDPLDLNHKIAEVLALTEHEFHRHNIVLRKDLDAALPRVSGDRVQVQQVLLNLIMNAIESMSAVHDRSHDLTIATRHDSSGAVVVEVSDSGIGLDPQQTEQLFEAFYTTKAEGIGIGLSISRSIIEAHGGRLWARPNTPHGAVFSFSLPVAEEEAS